MKEILENLRRAILQYDKVAAESWGKKAVAEGIDPLQALDVLTSAIREVGDGFGRGELWLPDLVGATTAMNCALPIIEEDIKHKGKIQKSAGRVVIGTVLGDIHDIGKSMVSALLRAGGFEVIDLGVNVSAERFIEAVNQTNPVLLAMSALLTTTAPELAKVINTFKRKGIRNEVKIMVGGGAITEKFAKDIGADGYAPTAPTAVKLARRLIGLI